MPHFKYKKSKYYVSYARLALMLAVAFIAGALIGALAGRIAYPAMNEYLNGDQPYISIPFIHPPMLDKADYDARMIALANYATTTPRTLATSTMIISETSTSKTGSAAGTSAGAVIGKPMASSAFISISTTTPPHHLWPAVAPYPDPGALLPFNRIVAYYGNFYSTAMGVLGQYPPDEVVQKLQDAAAQWQAADPSTHVIPAIDYIAVTAQGSPGPDGKYILRMPDSQIDKAVDMAKQVDGIVFLDIQPGQSTVQTEVPLLEKYLEMPQVELALDPEFSVKAGQVPGRVIGTMDASDIDFAAQFLANIVREKHLPPKILVVHRFTGNMVTDYEAITPLPEVQIVINMDGWGAPDKKVKTYDEVIYPEPVQFAGVKLFYKNDLVPPQSRLLAPAEVMALKPRPIYIQYQ